MLWLCSGLAVTTSFVRGKRADAKKTSIPAGNRRFFSSCTFFLTIKLKKETKNPFRQCYLTKGVAYMRLAVQLTYLAV